MKFGRLSVKFRVILLVLTILLVFIADASAANVSTEWFTVKGTQSFAVLQGDAKLYIKPSSSTVRSAMPSVVNMPDMESGCLITETDQGVSCTPHEVLSPGYHEWYTRKVQDRYEKGSNVRPVKTLAESSTPLIYESDVAFGAAMCADADYEYKEYCKSKRHGVIRCYRYRYTEPGYIKVGLYINDILIKDLAGYSTYDLDGRCSFRTWSGKVRVEALPYGKNITCKVLINNKFIKEITLTDPNKIRVHIDKRSEDGSFCSGCYGYGYLDDKNYFITKNTKLSTLENLGVGDLLKLTVSGEKIMPVTDYSSAMVIGSTGENTPYRTIFEATRGDEVIDTVTDLGTLSLSGADTIRIKVFGKSADVAMVLNGKSENELASSATATSFASAVVSLPLADKSFEVNGEVTLDLSPYLFPCLNPVVISARYPVEVKLDANPTSTPQSSSKSVMLTKAWHIFGSTELGQHTIVAKAVDEHNLYDEDSVNVGVSTSLEVDDPPTVKITNPAYDVVLPGDVQFVISASDDHAISLVELYINDSIVSEDIFSTESATLKHIENLAEGVYSIRAVAYDSSYQPAEDTMTLTVRNVKFPAISKIIIHSPDINGNSEKTYTFDGNPGGTCAAGSTYASGSEITVEAVVEKGDYNISYVRIGSIDNLEDRKGDDPCNSNNQNNPPKYWWFATPNYFSQPPYVSSVSVWQPWGKWTEFGIQDQSISAMVCDIKGFCSWETVKITGKATDDKAPDIEIIQPVNGETLNGQYTIKMHVTDDRGVDDVFLWMYNSENTYNLGYAALKSGTAKDGEWWLDYDFSGVTPGDYTIRATATDTGSNSDSATVDVAIGSAPTPTPAPTATPTLTPTPTPTSTPAVPEPTLIPTATPEPIVVIPTATPVPIPTTPPILKTEVIHILFTPNTHHTRYIFDEDKTIYGYIDEQGKPVWYDKPGTGAQDSWFSGAQIVGYIDGENARHLDTSYFDKEACELCTCLFGDCYCQATGDVSYTLQKIKEALYTDRYKWAVD